MTATYAKFTLQLNTVTDADVIEYLAAQANKNDTIREALRARAEMMRRLLTESQLPCSHCGALTKPEDFVDGVDGEMLCEACYQSHYTVTKR